MLPFGCISCDLWYNICKLNWLNRVIQNYRKEIMKFLKSIFEIIGMFG